MNRKFSNSVIDKAGKKLIELNIEDPNLKEFLHIIGDWRDAHFFALEKLGEQLSIKSKQVGGDNTIVSRLMKMESIKLKLTNTPTMKLSRMQDIGGCRIVVRDMKRLQATVSRFSKFHKGFELVEIDDYIKNPKLTGYRCVHIIFKLKDKNKESYKILIELQCRTELQHAWATAVETVGFFTKNALKSNQGEDYWKQFFVLVSKIFEYNETQNIANDNRSIQELVNDLISHDKKYKCTNKIAGYKVSTKIISEHLNEASYFLLVLNIPENRLEVIGYAKEDLEKAQEKYLSLEQENNVDINAVLVSADSMEGLEFGYQNYFNNTTLFLNKYNELVRMYKN